MSGASETGAGARSPRPPRSPRSPQPPPGFVLREAAPGDLPAICAMLHRAFDEHRGKLEPPSGVHAETPASLGKRMALGGAVLAVTGGEGGGGEQIVGCGFYEWRGDHVYIGRVGTLPEYRHAGVGTAILHAAEERARAKGVTRARLATRVHWSDLRRYYEARGYRAVSFGAHEGHAHPTYVNLEKDLATAAREAAGPGPGATPSGFRVVAADHVQLAMPKGGEDEARAFYAGVLGFAEIAKPSELADREGVWFDAGPLQVHLGVEAEFRPARKAHPGLRVEGLDALRARLTAAGRAPTPAPAVAGRPRFHALDPFGNRLEFLGETT